MVQPNYLFLTIFFIFFYISVFFSLFSFIIISFLF